MKDYLEQFEKEVIIPLFDKDNFSRLHTCSLRSGKLSKTKFGIFVGNSFECDKLCAIDYYGHIKKSSAMLETKGAYPGRQVYSLKTYVIYFASIKMEYIAECSPDLLKDFPTFKNFLLKLRGFK